MSPPLGTTHGQSLMQVSPGQEATVYSVEGPDSIVSTLSEIGIRAGASLRVLRRAPLGCPMVVAIDGARFAIRCDSARHVNVLPIHG